jgi:hypothetical protein
MSVLEKIRDKYAKTETVSDEYGRIIVVRRLNTSQRLAVREMANSGNPEVVGTMTLGASIVSIDDIVFPFPQNRKELNANLDVLDDPGLEALIKAYQKFNELSGQETIDAAKNLPGTPSFDSA